MGANPESRETSETVRLYSIYVSVFSVALRFTVYVIFTIRFALDFHLRWQLFPSRLGLYFAFRIFDFRSWRTGEVEI